MSWVTRVESEEQVMPQVKCVRRGKAQGSVAKSHEARQDHGWIELGLTEALKALRAEMSCGEVRATAPRFLVLKRMEESRNERMLGSIFAG